MLHAQGVAEAECRRAAAAAEEVYWRAFDVDGTPAEAEALLLEHLVRTSWLVLVAVGTTRAVLCDACGWHGMNLVHTHPWASPLLRRLFATQRCEAAAKATFKAIAVNEPRARAAAKAGLREALQQRFSLVREAALARAAAGVDAALLKAAQQITTVCGGVCVCRWGGGSTEPWRAWGQCLQQPACVMQPHTLSFMLLLLPLPTAGCAAAQPLGGRAG
jgi:hypothetical protein